MNVPIPINDQFEPIEEKTKEQLKYLMYLDGRDKDEIEMIIESSEAIDSFIVIMGVLYKIKNPHIDNDVLRQIINCELNQDCDFDVRYYNYD